VLDDVPRAAHEAAGVVNWYAWGEHVKAQVEYAFQHDESADPLGPATREAHRVSVQVQAGF
jgi:hypothetical protein